MFKLNEIIEDSYGVPFIIKDFNYFEEDGFKVKLTLQLAKHNTPSIVNVSTPTKKDKETIPAKKLNLKNLKKGALVSFSDGSEAICENVTSHLVYRDILYTVRFNRTVNIQEGIDPRDSACYNADGSLYSEEEPYNRRTISIVWIQ